MKSLIKMFRNLADWIFVHLRKEGVRNTVLAVLMTLFLLLIFNHFTNTAIQDLLRSVSQNTQEQIIEHRSQYSVSIEMYSAVKQVLKAQRSATGADYILYLEYHNGSENIATGHQFCKFDVTMEVLSDTVPYIIVDDYKDENLYRYDILISGQVTKSKVASFTGAEMRTLDRNFTNMVNPTGDIHHIVFYNIEHNNMTAGTLVFLYENRTPEYRTVTNCGNEIEKLIHDHITKTSKQ